MSKLTEHGAALLWKPELVWLNVVSDAVVAIAFFATTFVLAFFLWRRYRELMFRGVFLIFAVFVAVCGLTRLLSIYTMWVPAYEMETLIKTFLALISIPVTATLLLALPRIVASPSAECSACTCRSPAYQPALRTFGFAG